MDKYLEAFQQFFGPLSNAQRAMFIGLMLVVVGAVAGLVYWSQMENKALLFGSLQSEDAQEIVAELNSQGVEYELAEGGSSIYVPADRVHELRLQLAPLSGGVADLKGYELFDTNALGMTDFMQQVNKKRALEGELARSINSLEQVESSRIHLVMPERSPFEETAVQASASVILNLKRGKKLEQNQIEGISSLIAGSVETLDPANVTILDQAGNRLSDEVDYDSEFGMGSTQMQLRQKTEAYLTDRGQSMLDRVLGAGNSVLRVSVEHDFDQLTRESNLIDPDSRTVISEETREQTNNDEILEPLPIDQRLPVEDRGGAVVVSRNDNGTATETRNYEVNRTREVYEKTQGGIHKVTASVLLNHKRVTQTTPEGESQVVFEPYSAEEVEKFREVVALALGIQEDRGDLLTIEQVEFFDSKYLLTDEYTNTSPNMYNNVIRWALIALTFFAVLFLLNSIRKRMSNDDIRVVSDFEADDQLNESEVPDSLPGQKEEEMTENEEKKPEELSENAPKQLTEKKYEKEEIVNFIELKPAEAAQVARTLMLTDNEED
ncbi:flagellar basal-body MS-ring/collar protein FliF [Gracilimonas mengyeensis]|uniref:Flagellar M-ring protein n=1 Tax=Gracilimonas mengyeensis TaxID=1302730 RepID=A0A521EDC0_9BACT|nr:flagellar basal-body MS-ring/collar protein FliF [Gracilimonas mengyeensis]SMO81909.1 flagellar M-ring protein FliF [Gracilimonas mengyeensis]